MTKQKKAGIFSLGVGKRLSSVLTLMLTLAALLLPSSAKADETDEAWVEFDSDTQTLTFKYGEKPDSFDDNVKAYGLNEDDEIPEWNDNTYTTVVFDKSFSEVQPTTCCEWFKGQSSLTSINGLKYLNTEDVTDMSKMFYNCSALQKLDLSNFNTAYVTDMSSMFYNCTALTTIYAEQFHINDDAETTDMFKGCTSLVGAVQFDAERTDGTMANCKTGYFKDGGAWVEFDSNTQTLTFKYGEKPSSFDDNVTAYGLNEDQTSPEWNDNTYTKVVFDESFSNARPTTCYDWFSKQKTLTSVEGLEYLNTKEVENMCCMFQYCSSLKSLDLSSFETGNVTDMSYMFYECSSLQSLDLSSFNTENVTAMDYMFYDCSSLEYLDLSDFETRNVEYTMYMFFNCKALKELQLQNFNTEKVENMSYMFYGCEALQELDMSSFDTKNVEDMYKMFDGCKTLKEINVSKFNTEKVGQTAGMFQNCSSLESLNLSNFDTEKVTDMSNMFAGCEALQTLDVSSFNTAYVEDMCNMFDGCNALKEINLSNFNTENVTDISHMFAGCGNLTTIYADEYFTTDAVTNSEGMFDKCVKLVGAVAYDGSSTDGTMANYKTGYFTYKESITRMTWVEYDNSTNTLTFKRGTEKPSGNETVKVYELNENNASPQWNSNTYTSVVFDESFSKAQPTTCYEWFKGQSSLTSISGLEYLNTENVTDMSNMFYSCFGLESLDLTKLNTEKVTSMSCMFYNCSSLQALDLSNFNTANVSDMSNMFYQCNELGSLDLSNFNTDKVTNMKGLFLGCNALESLDLSDFSTANVTDMSFMFYNCTALTTIYVKQFDINDSANTDNMFHSSASLVGAVAYDGSSTGGTMANYKTGYFKTYYKIGDTKHDLCGETLSVDNLVLEDGKDFMALAPFTAANASFSRTMTSNWGTLCLPFAVDATSTSGCKFYEIESVDIDLLTLTRLEGTIAAGTPVLVYSTGDMDITASNVAVETAPADGDQTSGWQLVGSFTETEVPDDGYIISKNKFWLTSDLKTNTAAKAVKTKAMRAWLKPNSNGAEANAHVLSLALDEENEPTAVDTIEALTEGTTEIYDIQGRRIDSLQKGLNIIKTGSVTKKVMVK